MNVSWSITVHGKTLDDILLEARQAASAFFESDVPESDLDLNVTGFLYDMAGNIYSYEARVSITRP